MPIALGRDIQNHGRLYVGYMFLAVTLCLVKFTFVAARLPGFCFHGHIKYLIIGN